jgi:hypothetical protein
VTWRVADGALLGVAGGELATDGPLAGRLGRPAERLYAPRFQGHTPETRPRRTIAAPLALRARLAPTARRHSPDQLHNALPSQRVGN